MFYIDASEIIAINDLTDYTTETPLTHSDRTPWFTKINKGDLLKKVEVVFKNGVTITVKGRNVDELMKKMQLKNVNNEPKAKGADRGLKTFYCHVCHKETSKECWKTPSGSWGNVKCGKPICDDCECTCNKETTY